MNTREVWNSYAERDPEAAVRLDKAEAEGKPWSAGGDCAARRLGLLPGAVPLGELPELGMEAAALIDGQWVQAGVAYGAPIVLIEPTE